MAIAAVIAAYVVKPMATYALITTKSIIASYTKHEESELEKLKEKNERLNEILSKVNALADSGNSGSQWYAFIQNSLKANSIEPDMINASGLRAKDNLQSIDYTINCKTTYHNLGKFVSTLESGPYICAVEEAHLMSKSLINNLLEIELTVAFYRSGT